MKRATVNRSLAIFVFGAIAGTLLSGIWTPSAVADAQEQKESAAIDLSTLQQDIEVLKAKAPDQAHAMSDVDYHYANLWFAAKAEN